MFVKAFNMLYNKDNVKESKHSTLADFKEFTKKSYTDIFNDNTLIGFDDLEHMAKISYNKEQIDDNYNVYYNPDDWFKQ